MLRLLIDKNFNEDVMRGVLHLAPELDILRLADVELDRADDRTVLERAAYLNRVVVTSDVRTMVGFADERISKGGPLPGVIVGPQYIRVRVLIDDLALMAVCLETHEVAQQVKWIPIRH
jgi:hypothetical protein